MSAALADPERTVGRYALLSELGRGGMGVVYRAFDTGLRRAVAIKMILDPARAGEKQVARFAREAAAAAKLRHPGIVAVHEVGEHRGRPFIVMDLVEGESLEDQLRRELASPKRTAEIVMAVARALHHAHSLGVVHRDVKPHNVMMAPSEGDAVPLLMDFGLARDITAADEQLTVTGQMLGTPVYMSPEQAGGRTALQGPCSDIYSLGAVLYRMLVGRPPFEEAETVYNLVARILFEEPEAPRTINPGVHPDLETIALRCLEKEPARRYETAEALAEDLRRFIEGEPILARPQTGLERFRRRLRRNRAAVIAGSLVVVAAIVAGGAAIGLQAAERRRAVAEAWADGQAARERFGELARGGEYQEVHGAVLDAFARLDRVLNLDREHAEARQAKFDVAMRFGEIALRERDYGLATTMFTAALGLAIEDDRARARLVEVEDARGEEERRIREGIQRLFRDFEQERSDDPEQSWAPATTETAVMVAALAGGTREGSRILIEGLREIVLDRERPGSSRVVAGVVLGGIDPPTVEALRPLADVLAQPRADLVASVVAGHVLAARADPEWSEALREAWMAVAEDDAVGGATPELRTLRAEIARAMLVHGDPENVAIIDEGLRSDPEFELGRDDADWLGTASARTRRFYERILREANADRRWAIIASLDPSTAGGALRDVLTELLMAPPEVDSDAGWRFRFESTFTLDALFASAVGAVMYAQGQPSSTWQALRLLVFSGAGEALRRALDAALPWSRGLAALGLGEVDVGPEARAALMERLTEDASPWVRTCAAVALARQGVADGVTELERLVESEDGGATLFVAELRKGNAGFETSGTLDELFDDLRERLPPGPRMNAFAVYGTLGETGSAGGMTRAGGRAPLPDGASLLGRIGLTLRASSLRSEVANDELERELALDPSPGRVQHVLRLMGLYRHERAAEHAWRWIDSPDYCVAVEALRTLLEVRDPRAPRALTTLRERWRSHRPTRRGLEAQFIVHTPSAQIGSAGLYQEVLWPCIDRLGEYATVEAVAELLEWLDVRWFERKTWSALQRIGATDRSVLDDPSLPRGKAAFVRGWYELVVRGDRAAAAPELANAVEEGYAVVRARIALGWIALHEGDPERAREHLLEARRLGGGQHGADTATYWLGICDLFYRHDPLEAEACFRELVYRPPGTGTLDESGETAEAPPAPPSTDYSEPVPGVPELPPAGPDDVAVGPWMDLPDFERPSPFAGVMPSTAGEAHLRYLLCVERGLEKPYNESFESIHGRRIVPRLCELVFRRGDDARYGPLLRLLDEVEADMDRGAAWFPDLPVWRALAPAAAGKPEAAIEALAGLAEGEGRNAALAAWAIGKVEARRGRRDAAIRWLRIAVSREPRNPRWRVDLAPLLFEGGGAGLADEALDHARAAARVDPWVAVGLDATVVDWLRISIDVLTRDLPAEAGPLAERRARLVALVGDELPADPAAWREWWLDRRDGARNEAWDREAGRFRW